MFIHVQQHCIAVTVCGLLMLLLVLFVCSSSSLHSFYFAAVAIAADASFIVACYLFIGC